VCKRTLESLGEERDTADKQAKYLLDLAMKFQHVADLAIKADYGGDRVFDTIAGIRLATELVNRNEVFSKDLEEFGHLYQFQKGDHIAEEPPPPVKLPFDEDDENTKEKKSHHTITRHIANALELNEILSKKDEVYSPSKLHIFNWIKEMYSKSRGFELGTFTSSILTAAMRQQSSNWQAMTSGYTSDVVALVHNFITTLLQSLSSDNQVSERLLDLLMDGLLDKYGKSLAQAKFLLDVELSGVPMTLNHYFNDNLEKW
jgi:hypothetical protein